MSKALKGKLSRCSLVKATTEGVIRCDPYDKLDGPFFEKYVREQFPKLFGKANKNVVSQEQNSNRANYFRLQETHFLFVNRASSNTNCHEF